MSPRRSTASRLREELVDARERLAEGREAVRRQHDLGLSSIQVSRKLTSLADVAVRRIVDWALADLPTLVANRLRERCALVAHGGYGRRQMSPFSDVDVMILHKGRVDGDVEHFARRVMRDVFDVGLQLGQSLRTVEEAVRMARADAVICTSLIESRPLAGSSAVYDEFRAALAKMAERRRAALSVAFTEARREERHKFGDTVYLLEPNVKRSPGALRDLHLLRWLWFVHAGESDLDRLRMRGVISKFDHHRLTSARDFLMRVRHDLHFESGQPRDALTRAEQVRIAEKFAYYGSEGILPVERFMRDYFRFAGHISFLTRRMVELTTPKPAVDRVLGAVLGRTVERDFQLDVRDIAATAEGRAKLEHYLEDALRLFDLARLTDRRLGQDTAYLVYRSAPSYSSDLTPGVAERFLTILGNPTQLGDLLRRAHALGVLEKVIPEFAHARCLLQFNQYHKYTVDEHCIRAVEEATALARRKDALGDAYRRLTGKRLLHLALLIHDLGKGRPEDHSVVGERIAQGVAERLALPPDEAEQLGFLVREHLSMNRVAFRRNVNDPATIDAFAEFVGAPERLTLLYLMTCADMAAVGPGVLNDWKAEVLTQLYRRTLDALEPERRKRVQERRNAMRTATWQALAAPQRKDGWFKAQFQALPESFVATRSPSEVAATLQRLRGLPERAGDAWGAYREKSDTVEFIAGVDQGSGRGVFSSMAGALSAAGMQILTAETSMLAHDLLLLEYVAQDPRFPGGAPQERVDQVARALVASIDSDTPPPTAETWGASHQLTQAELTNLPNEVRLDGRLSEELLVIEVFTIDRRGLLYQLARALHELDLIIRFAKISTNEDQVIDVFFVSERDGGKPSEHGRMHEIWERLNAIVQEGPR